MEPADIGRLVSAADPRVSPDGALVAYTITRVDLDANRYRSGVWLARADGTGTPYQLTAGREGDGQPRWSPDGRRLAFTSRRGADGGASLHVVPVGGPGEVLTIAERSEAIEGIAWSPDGTRIAFASRERTDRYAAGDDDAARPPRRIDRLLTRLDDTGWIVDRPRSVFVVDVAGGAPRLVLGGPYEHGDPAWAPDGTRLAVIAARHEDWDLGAGTSVFLVPAAGGEPVMLTPPVRDHTHPSWSPDGTRVAVLATDAADGPRHSRVLVIDVGSGAAVDVTAGYDRQCAPFPGARPPLWDGPEAVLFPAEDGGTVPVLRAPADGSAPPEVVLGGHRCVTGFDLVAGTLAFTATDPAVLPELHVRVGDGPERRLTGVAAPFHASCPPRPVDRFAVPSPAGDGDVDAWLVHPPDTATARVPLLLSIHGGPATQYGERWFDEAQLYASAGYAVLMANPHGSTGGTQAWARAIRAPEAKVDPGTGWGGIDADDVLAVLDAALARYPFLDAARVGVLGGSYGGYLTTWLVGRTDRFAAACSERAANNLVSLDQTSDAAGHFHEVLGISPLDHPEALARMSPATYVRDIHTPMLLLHSEDDLRCPVEQADQLFVALRRLGRTVEYWRFPGESHELSRSGSPRHRVQRAEIILDFFARHLSGRRPPAEWLRPGPG